MSGQSSGRFQKGQSGNPKGRPKGRRPHVSAFDIILDKALTVTQNGVERELSVEEALEMQTYQAALGGSRMAIRKVLKMIEKREAAMAKKAPQPSAPMRVEHHCNASNANDALRILGIARPDPALDDRWWKLETWATQAAISRPGRRAFVKREVDNIKHFTFASTKLRWPRNKAQ